MSQTLAVHGAKGGVGASLLASQVALDAAGRARTALVDLDTSNGTSSALLGLRERAPALSAPRRGAGCAEVAAAARRHPSGLAVLDAESFDAASGPPDGRLDGQGVARLLTLARSCFDVVVVDVPARLDGRGRAALAAADAALLVVTPEVPCVMAARRLVDALAWGQFPLDRLSLVVNMLEEMEGVAPEEIAAALSLRLTGTVPFQPQVVRHAVNTAHEHAGTLGPSKVHTAIAAVSARVLPAAPANLGSTAYRAGTHDVRGVDPGGFATGDRQMIQRAGHRPDPDGAGNFHRPLVAEARDPRRRGGDDPSAERQLGRTSYPGGAHDARRRLDGDQATGDRDGPTAYPADDGRRRLGTGGPDPSGRGHGRRPVGTGDFDLGALDVSAHDTGPFATGDPGTGNRRPAHPTARPRDTRPLDARNPVDARSPATQDPLHRHGYPATDRGARRRDTANPEPNGYHDEAPGRHDLSGFDPSYLATSDRHARQGAGHHPDADGQHGHARDALGFDTGGRPGTTGYAAPDHGTLQRDTGGPKLNGHPVGAPGTGTGDDDLGTFDLGALDLSALDAGSAGSSGFFGTGDPGVRAGGSGGTAGRRSRGVGPDGGALDRLDPLDPLDTGEFGAGSAVR